MQVFLREFFSFLKNEKFLFFSFSCLRCQRCSVVSRTFRNRVHCTSSPWNQIRVFEAKNLDEYVSVHHEGVSFGFRRHFHPVELFRKESKGNAIFQLNFRIDES